MSVWPAVGTACGQDRTHSRVPAVSGSVRTSTPSQAATANRPRVAWPAATAEPPVTAPSVVGVPGSGVPGSTTNCLGSASTGTS